MDLGIFVFYEMVLLEYFMFDHPIPRIKLYCT